MTKFRTSKEFQDQGILNKAMNLSMYELLGDASMINSEKDNYLNISPKEIQAVANSIFQKTNCSLLKIKAQNND